MTAAAAARALLARPRRRTLALPERGVELAALDWGGDGPVALLHHANGFCKGVWALVAESLRARWRVIAIDARGHGDSSKPDGAGAYRWDAFAEDLAAVAMQLRRESGAPLALGIGHSFGGTAMIGAAARHADLFERLLLVDPVVPPPPAVLAERPEHIERLVQGALRRRAEWPSRQAARDWCARRTFFADWLPEAIELYLLDGMHERPDGSLVLKCPGAVEGAVFAGSGELDIFARARHVVTPTLLLWAERGDFPRAVHEAVAAAMTDGRVEPVAAGHLIPMEQPEVVVAAAQRLAG